MTDHTPHRAAAILRASASRPVDIETLRRETWASAWSLAWQQAVEWAAAAAYDAAHRDLNEEIELAFSAGRDAGMLEGKESNDRVYRAAYLDACRDNEAVIRRLRERIAELEAAP